MAYDVTVVMPALNEERNLDKAVQNVISAFEELKISGELVIVNDGSTDKTGLIAARMMTKHNFVKTVTHESPQGIGRGFWDGMLAGDSEIVTLLPGDAENDAFEILRYLPLMRDVDLVIPFIFNRGSRSRIRQWVSRAYRFVINFTFGTSLNYMNGTVMYRKRVLKTLDLKSNGFFYQTELLMKCLRQGYLYAEVPSGLKRREGGESKALSMRALKTVIRDYLAALFSLTPRDSDPIPDSATWQRLQKFNAAESLASSQPALGSAENLV